MSDHDSDHDSELLFTRAASALRAPHPNDAVEMEQLINQLRATPVVRTPRYRPVLRLSSGIAAAIAAFMIGLGFGRVGHRPALVGQVASIDANEHPIAFVFVAPAARNVSLVGDFNGWDAGATPLQRTDGRNTWSVAVQLPPGRHVYAFVIDGVTWVADPQAPLAPEQWFGQRNSVIVIPEDRRS